MESQFLSSILDVSAADWDRLQANDYPFTQHAYLAALERSGCTTRESGWQPHHCLLYENDQLIAAAPVYLKYHSYGEYVFDWAWANAYHDHGLNYYPKLLNAIPFTPATGPRWLIQNGVDYTKAYNALQQALLTQALDCESSSVHCLFPEATLLKVLENQSQWILRIDCQYHWFNRNYKDFSDFLADLTSRKRKNIKKERIKVSQQNVQVQKLKGNQLTREDWQGFYQLYVQTYLKRSGHAGYLNKAFFVELGQSLPNQVLMVKAQHQDTWVAAALYFYDQNTLYGRYWGCLEEFDALHFECCYYQGIEFAIEHNLKRFDPGAQGEHKVLRGFQPVKTASLHYIQHPAFANAIKHFVEQEKPLVQEHCTALRADLPFSDNISLVNEEILLAGED